MLIFSSRRRHTMSKRDWSSDVCSSDLERGRQQIEDQHLTREGLGSSYRTLLTAVHQKSFIYRAGHRGGRLVGYPDRKGTARAGEIGRASCREREEELVQTRTLKQSYVM